MSQNYCCQRLLVRVHNISSNHLTVVPTSYSPFHLSSSNSEGLTIKSNLSHVFQQRMDEIVVVTAEEQLAFLNHDLTTPEEEIVPSTKSDDSSTPTRRLSSLDVFRGLTVALMILVDDAGGAFPSINHSPWFGVTLADFVMPFFLFIVGVSVALAFKEPSNKVEATRKVAVRTIKLFLLGVLLQGGYFHGHDDLTYGVDIARIRFLGVLQRIAIGYFLAAVSRIWLVNDASVDSSSTFLKKYCIQWMVAILLSTIYLVLLYTLYVPDWKFEATSVFTSPILNDGAELKTVSCGVRGSLSPPCNAVGFIDRLFLGEEHLYQRPVYRRTKECSTNSPDYGPLPTNAPVWCLAPFDPEGILSSLMAAVSCFIGMHFGNLIVHTKAHKKRMLLWLTSSLIFLLTGYALKVIGLPLSKPLYTVSYALVTAGVAGLVLTVTYFIVDVKNLRSPVMLLQWMGMNAFLVYALAACELFPAAIQGFYLHNPENNLVNVTETKLQEILHSESWGTMAFVLLEIIFWCLFAGFLNKKGIYIKL